MQENGDTTVDVEVARDALEKFVMENDELLELEARIGRFNIFDALGIVNAEIKHSNFLGWLLDPAESHGAGDLFLKAILMDMTRGAPCPTFPRPLDLYAATLDNVRVWRERLKVDVLILSTSPPFVVAIENKVKASEHGDQLSTYADRVAKSYVGIPALFVYLTPDGDDPSEANWMAYSYADLHDALSRAHKITAWDSHNPASLVLNDYLRTIRSHVMDQPDKDIQDLCRRIYKKHPEAVRLLAAHLADASPLLARTREIVEEMSGDFELLATRSGVYFVPHKVKSILPAIDGSQSWLLWRFDCGTHSRNKLRLMLTAERCSESTMLSLRRRILDALVTELPDYLKYPQKTSGNSDRQVRLRTEYPYEFDDPDNIDIDQAEQLVRTSLVSLTHQIPRMTTTIERAMDAGPDQ